MAIDFDSVKKGDVFPGIEVIAKRSKTVLAIYTCCGKKVEVKKRTLERRIESESDTCSECIRRERRGHVYTMFDEDDAPLIPAPARFSGVYFEPGRYGAHWWASLSAPSDGRSGTGARTDFKMR